MRCRPCSHEPPRTGRNPPKAGDVLQFTLVGLVIFSVALIAAAALIGYKLAAIQPSKAVGLFHGEPE